MTAETVVLLLGAGALGGIVTAIVGGASLITFPALLAVGIPPVVANASNTVALTPANFMAALADRERLPRPDGALALVAAVSIAGSVAGAVLLMLTPERAFTALVPALIGLATALFAASERVREALRRRALSRAAPAAAGRALGLAVYAPLAIYGGYFGAGMSVMLLAILSVQRGGDFRAANALKNLLSGLISVVALAVFVLQGLVSWPATLAVMAGAIAGGYGGGVLARSLPKAMVRAVVIAAGAVLTLVYAWRYWGPG